MKIALIISTLIIIFLVTLIIYQGSNGSRLVHKIYGQTEDIKSYELLTDALLKAEGRQFETLKEQLLTDFSFYDEPVQYSDKTYGIIIWWKGIVVRKRGQHFGMKLLFDKEDRLISVRANKPKM